VTDNASNLSKAFRKYQPLEEDEDDERQLPSPELSAMKIRLIAKKMREEGDMRDSNVEVQEGLDGREECEACFKLPKHLRCAAHILRLVAVNDCHLDKIHGSRADAYRTRYREAFSMLNRLWNHGGIYWRRYSKNLGPTVSKAILRLL